MANEENLKPIDLYCIKNFINSKIYIGQTMKGFKDRWLDHLSLARTYKRKSKLYNAMKKYGIHNFQIEKLCTVLNEDEANELEEFLILETNSHINGYNIRQGGNNSSLSESTKRKLSIFNKGKKLSNETKNKISLASKKHYQQGKLSGLIVREKGYHQTEETKKRISEALKGKEHSKENRDRHIAILLNYKRTPESEKKRIMAIINKITKKVDQLTLNGNFIKTWPSATEAGENLKISPGTIRANIQGRRKTGKGYLWRYSK